MTEAHEALQHRLRRMTGRSTGQQHRASTPLELLFDLTFVVGFGTASGEAAHLLAEGHVAAALTGFGFSMFAIVWAWINFSWFASAFDTDDWLYRVTTMVQMVGVIVLSLGLPAAFESIAHGEGVELGLIAAGYVVMRVALLTQWLRVAVQDPAHRAVALRYAFFLATSQVGWVILVFLREAPWWMVLPLAIVVVFLDVGGVVIAERTTNGTPWHADHIAERYGLLVIIALGEVILGTVASVSAAVQRQSWSPEAVLIVVSGVGLCFALWWLYFLVPSGKLLSEHRQRGFVWGYGHLVIYAAIAGAGAGLHAAALLLEGETHIGETGTVLAVAVPVLVFVIALHAMTDYLLHAVDAFHTLFLAGSVLLLGVAVALSLTGVGFGVCLLVVAIAPVVALLGCETRGYRRFAAVLP